MESIKQPFLREIQMKNANFLTSACRYCRFYQPEGRRGGFCKQLSVPVQSGWKSCALASHPFSNNWEDVENVVRLGQTTNSNYSSVPVKSLEEPVIS
jgi:hypothetical protein